MRARRAGRRRIAPSAGATSAATGTNGLGLAALGLARARRPRRARSPRPRSAGAGRGAARARPRRRARAGPGRRAGRASCGSSGRPGDRAHEAPDDLAEDQRRLGRRRVDADAQARDVDALADHVDRDDPALGGAREGLQLLRRARLGVQHDGRRAPGDLPQHLGDRAGVLAVGGDDEPAGVAVARRRAPAPGARARRRGCAAGRRRARARSPCGSAGPPRARSRASAKDDSTSSSPLRHCSTPS